MIKIGQEITQSYRGMTVTSGNAIIDKTWKVQKDLGNDKYECLLLDDNSVMRITEGYTETFEKEDILEYLK